MNVDSVWRNINNRWCWNRTNDEQCEWKSKRNEQQSPTISLVWVWRQGMARRTMTNGYCTYILMRLIHSLSPANSAQLTKRFALLSSHRSDAHTPRQSNLIYDFVYTSHLTMNTDWLSKSVFLMQSHIVTTFQRSSVQMRGKWWKISKTRHTWKTFRNNNNEKEKISDRHSARCFVTSTKSTACSSHFLHVSK